jgi:hypothetical protein
MTGYLIAALVLGALGVGLCFASDVMRGTGVIGKAVNATGQILVLFALLAVAAIALAIWAN